MTMQEFLKTVMHDSLTMQTVKIKIMKRPDGPVDDSTMSYYRCTLRVSHAGTDGMTVFYSMGSAHKDPPTLEGVLDSMAMDSECLNTKTESAMTFNEWCEEYGYDDDSRTAERIYHYQTCVTQSIGLRNLIGVMAWKTLTRFVDRL